MGKRKTVYDREKMSKFMIFIGIAFLAQCVKVNGLVINKCWEEN